MGEADNRSTNPFQWLSPLLERQHHDDESSRDRSSIDRWIGAVRAYTRYFSPEVRGIEHVPVKGPALVIGNHNCLFYMPDAWISGLSIIERRGLEDPVHVLAHDFLFAVPGVGRFLRSIGAVPATGDRAESLLRDGGVLLDYPGGDWEACRPWRDRHVVDFAGRTGFARLALRAGVPIVPVVAHGSHEAVVVLFRGERMARMMGLGALRFDVFPIVLGPFGPSTVLTPPPPLPSSVTVEFLEPIEWTGLGPGAAEDPLVVGRCAAEVLGSMQVALNRLAEERPHPVRRGVRKLLTGAWAR
jgi:1-acyl-sn-glycerol-3-phosphate acyltransferase